MLLINQSQLISDETIVDPCYDRGYYYPGGETTNGTLQNVISMEACQIKCVETDECKYFTWGSEDKSCNLKSFKSYLKTAEHSISGPKFCNGESKQKPQSLMTSCFEHGVDYDGEAIARFGYEIDSVEDCQFKCLENVDCQIFVYYLSTNDEHRCYLKPARTKKLYNQANAISGPKLCGMNCYILLVYLLKLPY